MTGVGGDLLHGGGQGVGDDLHTGLLVALQSRRTSFIHSGNGVHIGGAAAGHDALFHSGAGGVQSVLDAQTSSPSSPPRWQRRP